MSFSHPYYDISYCAMKKMSVQDTTIQAVDCNKLSVLSSISTGRKIKRDGAGKAESNYSPPMLHLSL